MSELRSELENLKFEKKKEVQETILSSSDEIKQLKSSAQTLRDELEKVITNYEFVYNSPNVGHILPFMIMML